MMILLLKIGVGFYQFNEITDEFTVQKTGPKEKQRPLLQLCCGNARRYFFSVERTVSQ
jgi:hypothetical protein